MHIEIIAVGQKMPDWVNRGYADYADRLTGDLTLGLTEIPLQKRGSASQLAAAQNKEAAQIRSALHACDHIITLDIPGREHSSESLAARLQYWQENHRHLALIIGGPEGIAAVRGGRYYGKGEVADLEIPRAVGGPQAHWVVGSDGIGDFL